MIKLLYTPIELEGKSVNNINIKKDSQFDR